MKKIFFFLLLNIILAEVHGQDYVETVGEKFKFKSFSMAGGYYQLQELHAFNGNYFAIGFSERHTYIKLLKISNIMNVVEVDKIFLLDSAETEMSKSVVYGKSQLIDENLLIFFSAENSSEKKQIFYAKKINLNTKESSLIKIGAVNTKDYDEGSRIEMYYNESQKSILAFASFANKEYLDKKETRFNCHYKIHVTIYDKDLNVISPRENVILKTRIGESIAHVDFCLSNTIIITTQVLVNFDIGKVPTYAVNYNVTIIKNDETTETIFAPKTNMRGLYTKLLNDSILGYFALRSSDGTISDGLVYANLNLNTEEFDEPMKQEFTSLIAQKGNKSKGKHKASEPVEKNMKLYKSRFGYEETLAGIYTISYVLPNPDGSLLVYGDGFGDDPTVPLVNIIYTPNSSIATSRIQGSIVGPSMIFKIEPSREIIATTQINSYVYYYGRTQPLKLKSVPVLYNNNKLLVFTGRGYAEANFNKKENNLIAYINKSDESQDLRAENLLYDGKEVLILKVNSKSIIFSKIELR
jgi:hypothetical protein